MRKIRVVVEYETEETLEFEQLSWISGGVDFQDFHAIKDDSDVSVTITEV